MWCVPMTIAAILGTTKEDVWHEILTDRLLRPSDGRPARRLTNLPGDPLLGPHGGVHAAEGFRVLARRGYTLVEAWPGSTGRRSWLTFAHTAPGRDGGTWILMMQAHLDLHVSGITKPWSGFEVRKAWRVVPPM